jgi:hypothetical protein
MRWSIWKSHTLQSQLLDTSKVKVEARAEMRNQEYLR